ncbi:coiled-coil domain-containing protein 134-like [Ptychodera flava]|uniref:coiled-coil domain-containing protein 134-like n=1 Tax=Ptychodera flava TaxID=63121 RepID=UPI00396A7827
MRSFVQFCFVASCLFSLSTCEKDKKSKESTADVEEDKGLLLYRQLFQTRRQDHMEAINNILALQDYEKQYKLIKMVYEKLFEVLSGAKTALEQINFNPSDRFPTDDMTKEAVSSVLENTAFFGEVLLRLPDISHDIYEKRKDWLEIMTWAIKFSEKTRVFEGIHGKFLNLVGQELNIFERDPDYQNPYSLNSKLKFQGSEPISQKPKKKEKKPKKRGPRLSQAKTEL